MLCHQADRFGWNGEILFTLLRIVRMWRCWRHLETGSDKYNQILGIQGAPCNRITPLSADNSYIQKCGDVVEFFHTWTTVTCVLHDHHVDMSDTTWTRTGNLSACLHYWNRCLMLYPCALSRWHSVAVVSDIGDRLTSANTDDKLHSKCN